MKTWLIGLVVHYVITQIALAGSAVDWAALTGKIEAEVDKYVPGFLKASVDGIVKATVATIQSALADTEWLTALANQLEAGNLPGALLVLENALAASTHVDASATKAAVSTLRAA